MSKKEKKLESIILCLSFCLTEMCFLAVAITASFLESFIFLVQARVTFISIVINSNDMNNFKIAKLRFALKRSRHRDRTEEPYNMDRIIFSTLQPSNNEIVHIITGDESETSL